MFKMKKALILVTLAACGQTSTNRVSPSAAQLQDLIVDHRCTTNAECPAGFECEIETEHLVATSFCKAHQVSADNAGAACPSGTTLEAEDDNKNWCDDENHGHVLFLDTPCGAEAACPAGFECETEEEHGVTTSFCKANKSHQGSATSCPEGLVENRSHGRTACVTPEQRDNSGHGNADDNNDANDDSNDDESEDNDDHGGDVGATGTSGTAGASGSAQTACQTDADCPSGQECESEDGSSFCKAHGGK